MISGISSGVRDAVLAHAAADERREVCGVLLARGDTVVEAVAARNVAPHPETGFEIDPALLLATYRRARGESLSVAGWYHSHPNGVGEPSVTDAARAVEDGKLWVIAAGGALRAWRVVPDGAVQGRFERVALHETPLIPSEVEGLSQLFASPSTTLGMSGFRSMG